MKKVLIAVMILAVVGMASAVALPFSDNFDDQVIGDDGWTGDVDVNPGWLADGTGAEPDNSGLTFPAGSAVSDDELKYMHIQFDQATDTAVVEFDHYQLTTVGGAWRFNFGFTSSEFADGTPQGDAYGMTMQPGGVHHGLGGMYFECSPQEWRFGPGSEGQTSIVSMDGAWNYKTAGTDPDGDIVQPEKRLSRGPGEVHHYRVEFDGTGGANDIMMKVYQDGVYAGYIQNYYDSSSPWVWSEVDGFVLTTYDQYPIDQYPVWGAEATWVVDNFTADVPEPATMALLALGGLALRRRK
jgi:hypothetical protein